LEEELLKPAGKSGVQAAALSQPLCTAIQIALVDLFAAVGVEPYAVVGHSSGEIAAAYAAGALTAREAIIAAWQRGRAAKMQTRPGAMAAVGLSWDEVNSFMAPGVVVACENSPKSVTLSGDTNEVQATVLRIKQSHPEVTVRLLKVDKAYHSYHMQEIGDEYRSVLQRDLAGRLPLKPFFSSVTGEQEEGLLDAEYWQKNLESPVLFRAAVSGILKHVDNIAFLEIGPHAALAGPVRQILTQASSSSPYISAMTRGQDCVETFLAAIGRLFELNISVDFNILMPSGSCLPDLPRYPWDHEADYWRESRISHEWRYREHPSHPLLGIRQLESTSLEPSWRNMLHVDKVSWLQDHKIEDNIIFPCAGYIAMVGEGMRQISGSQNSFALRHIVISSALVLAEETPTELVTTFRPYRLTDSLDSQWWDFTIASHNGHLWMKHCTGQVTSKVGEPPQAQDAKLLPRKLEPRKHYDIMNRAGLRFGPRFQRYTDIRTSIVQHLAAAKLCNDKSREEEHYHLHPTTIDACIQLAPLAASKGLLEVNLYRAVPTKIKKVTIYRCASDVGMSVSGSATRVKGSGDIVGRLQQCIAGGNVVMHLEGLHLSLLEEVEETETDGLHTTARLTWRPHIDFLDAANLVRPSIPRHLYAPSLDELARLCLVYSYRQIKVTQTEMAHMQKYRAWIDSQVQTISNAENSAITALDDAVIMGEVGRLVRQLSDTPVAACAVAIQKVVNNISALFSGQTQALDILLADDTLTKLYIATDACDRSQFIQHLAHSKPNLRILEIGAGTGASTASMLKDLFLPEPIKQPLYSKYTFTDISTAFFVSAKDHFKHHRNIEYRVLDISKDPMEQGFDGEKYDLIIATNVIHATKSLGDSLKNVRKLLDPNGRLLLHELYSHSKWPNFIFGTLPGWWYGELDGRPDEPCVGPARWELELTRAGFASLDAVILDSQEPHQLNAIMVAKPQINDTRNTRKTVTILCDRGENHVDSLSQQLQSRGYVVHQCQLGEELPGSQDVISLLDCSRPFFEDISEARYKAFQSLLDNLGEASLLWVTHPCQVQCGDPRYAQIIGAACCWTLLRAKWMTLVHRLIA
jgi:acyl transferase domain-containing protein